MTLFWEHLMILILSMHIWKEMSAVLSTLALMPSMPTKPTLLSQWITFYILVSISIDTNH